MSWDRIFRPRRYEHDGAVRRDPLSIGVAFLVNIGWTGAISGIGATIVGSVILGAAALGVSLLSNALFAPRVQERSPSERQATIRQSLGARIRFYGRVKVGGTLWFLEAKNGYLYSGVTLNEGRISEVKEYWLNDQKVTLDDDGYVKEKPYVYTSGSGKKKRVARILVKDGHPNQTVHGALDNAFIAVTAAHRLRGVANFLSVFDEVPADKIAEVYPQLNPQARLVIDASLVNDVRTGVYAWSDNPANGIYDYLTAVDGAGYAYGAGYLESQIDLPSFQALADLSDQSVQLKAGGTIKRYRMWGGFAMNEEQRAVLPRMLRTCDCDLFMTNAGKIAIRGGKWEEPVLTLDAREGHIISAQFKHGQGTLAAFNELTITYTEPAIDFQENEAERWLDAGNVAMRGQVLSSQLDLLMVPHHAQARRLGKIYTARSNPEWVGTITTNYFGFNAIGENTVRVIFPLLNIDRSFVIQSVKILDDMTGCEISVTSMSASAYEWDPELEEGAAPGMPPDTSSPITLDPPSDINVSAVLRDGVTFLVATWTEPERTALEQEVEYRTSPGGTWIRMLVSDGVGVAESGVVTTGADYDVRVRTRSPGGQYGDYSPTFTVEATADITEPLPVTGLSASVNDDQVDMSFTMSSSLNSIGARIYRNSVNDDTTASMVGSVFGSPLTQGIFSDAALSAGTYYYWVASINGSNFVEGDFEATGPQVVI